MKAKPVIRPGYLRKVIREILDAERAVEAPEIVSFRVLSVDFDNRTIRLDGATHKIDHRAVDIPIMSGGAIFMASRDWERIA